MRQFSDGSGGWRRISIINHLITRSPVHLILLLLPGCTTPEPGAPAEMCAGVGVEDRVKAVVFRQGSVEAAMVFFAANGVSGESAKRVRGQIEGKAGIPASNVCIAATTMRGDASSDASDLSVGRILKAVTNARAALRPVALKAGAARQIKRISFNRRFHMKDGTVRTDPGKLNPDIVKVAGPVDSEIGLLSLHEKGGDRPAEAVLATFAMRSDTTGGTDYPFCLEHHLRENCGVPHTLFSPGACCDVGSVDIRRQRRSTPEELGAELGKTAAAALPRLEPVKTPVLEIRRAGIGVLEVQVFRLGKDLVIVALPGEVFVELGLAVKLNSPFRHTMVISRADGDPGCIPTRKAFLEGAREAKEARVRPGDGEKMVEVVLKLLEEMSGRPSPGSRIKGK